MGYLVAMEICVTLFLLVQFFICIGPINVCTDFEINRYKIDEVFENTLLPMTMTCDRLKFWSGPAWRSKVIIRKPWRKTIRHSRREAGNA